MNFPSRCAAELPDWTVILYGGVVRLSELPSCFRGTHGDLDGKIPHSRGRADMHKVHNQFPDVHDLAESSVPLPRRALPRRHLNNHPRYKGQIHLLP